jgi:CRP/FNR family transcriptional regulator, cyclic AMP receptor protein
MSDLMIEAPVEIHPGVLDALTRCELFEGLPPQILHELAQRSSLRTARRGERVWDQGGGATALAVVATGRVKCWIPGRESRQWVNVVARAGGFCGLAACVDGGGHTCNAEPLERSRIVWVPALALRSAMEKVPSFARRVALLLARDVRRLLSACEDITLHTPIERLARYLAVQVNGNGVVELRETQTQIAAQLGTVREVVGRGLRALESRGIISRSGRVVRVLKLPELHAIAKQ